MEPQQLGAPRQVLDDFPILGALALEQSGRGWRGLEGCRDSAVNTKLPSGLWSVLYSQTLTRKTYIYTKLELHSLKWNKLYVYLYWHYTYIYKTLGVGYNLLKMKYLIDFSIKYDSSNMEKLQRCESFSNFILFVRSEFSIVGDLRTTNAIELFYIFLLEILSFPAISGLDIFLNSSSHFLLYQDLFE